MIEKYFYVCQVENGTKLKLYLDERNNQNHLKFHMHSRT